MTMDEAVAQFNSEGTSQFPFSRKIIYVIISKLNGGIMTSKPTGTVTFLFTDIEGSTKLSQQYPNAMREKIGDHRPPVEQASVEKDLEVVHSKVDDAEFTRLSIEGRTMTVE